MTQSSLKKYSRMTKDATGCQFKYTCYITGNEKVYVGMDCEAKTLHELKRLVGLK